MSSEDIKKLQVQIKSKYKNQTKCYCGCVENYKFYIIISVLSIEKYVVYAIQVQAIA